MSTDKEIEQKIESEGKRMSNNNLRPVEINGHQEHWIGTFHMFALDGTAIVETSDGEIRYVPGWKIKFLDKTKGPA